MPDEHVEAPANSGTEISSIPEESAAPKEGKLPARYGKIHNLAGDAVLCETVRSWASTNIRRFQDQSPREKYVEDGGIKDINDRMYRVSLQQDTTNSQKKNTLSDVTSPAFRVAVRAIMAAQNAIQFPDDRLPAEYEPEINTTEYTTEDGANIAERQNALEQLTFDEDKRIPKIKELVEYKLKDGMRVAMVEWIREEEEVTENVPDVQAGLLENGQWAKIDVKTHKRVTRDWPVLTTDDMAHWHCDALITELEDGRCVAHDGRVGIEELYGQQGLGYMMNVGKVDRSQLYKGEDANDEDSPLERRQKNAGEDGDTEETGELSRWRVWGLMPISERSTPKGKRKAKWDEKKNLPVAYEAYFVGDIHSGGAVCTKLIKNPHRHRKLVPAKIIRDMRDDKGAFSVSLGEMMASLYWQVCTNLNQSIDNVTERNWAPMVGSGQIKTRDLTFRKNKLIEIAQSAKLERLTIPDTTQITMEMHRIIREMIDELIGAVKPVKGEAFGARTSATEASTTTDFALQPLEESTTYFMDQFYPWLLELDASYWRQYGDPDLVKQITHNNKDYDIFPTALWGPIKTKVTALARFRKSTIEKTGLLQFVQNGLPVLIDSVPPAGKRVLGRELLRIMGVDKANEIFPVSGNIEASAAANRTVDTILSGGFVQPQDGEDHAARLTVLKAALRSFSHLPEAAVPPKDVMDNLRSIIELRQTMLDAERTEVPAGGAGQQAPAALEGQATGDLLAGAAGGAQA